MELQIDTSTRYASVGLSIEGRLLVEIAWRSERNHSVELTPAINRALEHASARITDLKAVFSASGPGAFSALRVGMSTAKAVASTREIPLVTVGTLEIELHPFRELGLPLCAITSAGRSRVYTGRTSEGSDSLEVDVEAVDEFLESTSSDVLYCGEAVFELADQIKSAAGPGVMLHQSVPPTRGASDLAHLGYQKLLKGETVDPGIAEPIYLRSSQIASAARRWASGRRSS